MHDVVVRRNRDLKVVHIAALDVCKYSIMARALAGLVVALWHYDQEGSWWHKKSGGQNELKRSQSACIRLSASQESRDIHRFSTGALTSGYLL